MAKKPVLNPIEQFLALSEKRLRGRLEPDKVATTLMEAREHLTYRAEELMEAGQAPDAAMAMAAETFGQPRKWTREILLSENYKPYLQIANGISVAACAYILVLKPLWTLFLKSPSGGEVTPGYLIFSAVLTALLHLAAGLGALIARRCAVKPILGIIVAGALMFCIGLGFMTNPVMSQAQKSLRDDATLLQQGIRAYSSKTLPNVPAALKMPEGFVAPIARKRVSSLEDVGSGSTEIVATEEMAASRWRDYGALRLAECREELGQIKRLSDWRLSTPQLLLRFGANNFNAAAALLGTVLALLHGVFCLMLCGVSAQFGRFIHRVHMAWLSQDKIRRSPIN
ncbi:MAG: hypothetical protein ABIY70_15045 [Capsulimonas sp.]|uniref:hypothetical protein n=1 Tax=Capsulimonas sp. TaxID=2494211 RepID=UPI0032676A4A